MGSVAIFRPRRVLTATYYAPFPPMGNFPVLKTIMSSQTSSLVAARGGPYQILRMLAIGRSPVGLEVDRDTGEITILRYIGVHDCGGIANPKLVALCLTFQDVRGQGLQLGGPVGGGHRWPQDKLREPGRQPLVDPFMQGRAALWDEGRGVEVRTTTSQLLDHCRR